MRNSASDKAIEGWMDIATWLVANKVPCAVASRLTGGCSGLVASAKCRRNKVWSTKLQRAQKARDLLAQAQAKPSRSERDCEIIREGLRLMDEEGFTGAEVESELRRRYRFKGSVPPFHLAKMREPETYQLELKNRAVPDLAKYCRGRHTKFPLYVYFRMRKVARKRAEGYLELMDAEALAGVDHEIGHSDRCRFEVLWDDLCREAEKEQGLPPGMKKRTNLLLEGGLMRARRQNGTLIYKADHRAKVGRRRGPVHPDILKWDAKAGELRSRNQVLRKVDRRRAKNVVTILDAFQKQGWPRHIRNPLSGKGAHNTSCLRAAIKSLNKGLKKLRFHTDEGEFILWDIQPLDTA